MAQASGDHMTVRRDNIITSELFAKALQDAGVIDDGHVRRVVIDAQAAHALMIHVEYFGDTKLLDVVRTLDGMEVHCGRG